MGDLEKLAEDRRQLLDRRPQVRGGGRRYLDHDALEAIHETVDLWDILEPLEEKETECPKT